MTRDELSQAAADCAKRIKAQFPTMRDEDCGAWAKFIVASAKCLKTLGPQHMERVFAECGKRFLTK